MIRFYLNEEPILANVKTTCSPTPSSCEHVSAASTSW
jgi:uncharacterized circularly permuted ATP-grasp superfamily protein